MKKLLYNITITSFCVIVLYLALDTHIYAQTMELMERSILLFNDGNPIKKAAISVSKNPVTIYNGAGFVTDTSIGIKHLEYIKPNTNEFWTENPFYSLSTNAPISVNGILGDNEIRSTKKIRSGTLIQKNLINVGPTIPAQRPLCAATNVNGNFIACTNTSINKG